VEDGVVAIQYDEHPIESGIPLPKKGSNYGRNQRLAAKMRAGDSVLIESGRAYSLAHAIKRLGGKAITEDAGMHPAADSYRDGELMPHRRVWRVS
jgi:hypothetical protein